jgi:hypothetical protein
MRQFDIVRNPSTHAARNLPFLVVLQHHFVNVETVLVAPMSRDVQPIPRLFPLIVWDGYAYRLLVTETAPIERRRLGPRAGDCVEFQDDIKAALDLLFTGF